MRNKHISRNALILLLLMGVTLSMTSCAQTWSWLWSREENVTIDTGDMIYGGGAEGVQVYVDKLKAELEDTMAMCGAHSLSEITSDMVSQF